MIDLTMSDLETNEDDGSKNEDDGNDFIDNNDDDDDDGPSVNNFFMKMKVDPTCCPKGRVLCEWDLEYWHGY